MLHLVHFRVNVGKYMVNYTMHGSYGQTYLGLMGTYEGAPRNISQQIGCFFRIQPSWILPIITKKSTMNTRSIKSTSLMQWFPCCSPMLLPFFPMVLPTFRLRHCNTATSIMRRDLSNMSHRSYRHTPHQRRPVDTEALAIYASSQQDPG